MELPSVSIAIFDILYILDAPFRSRFHSPHPAEQGAFGPVFTTEKPMNLSQTVFVWSWIRSVFEFHTVTYTLTYGTFL